MPNHITNRVSAPADVLRSMINDQGHIDFNKLLPFKGEYPWDFISGNAETAAEAISGTPMDNNPLIRQLQESNRSRADVTKLSDEEFEQFVQMLRNKRSCGFFHGMDFARQAWGTKWNAYDQDLEVDQGLVSFDTAWSCPIPIFEALSTLHPDAEIVVQFADEDIGSNCGAITLKGGQITAKDCAGNWNSMTSGEQEKWRAFAYGIKGWEPEGDDE